MYYYTNIDNKTMKTSQKIYLPIKRLIGIVGSIVGIAFCLALLWWWVFIVNLIVTKGHPVFAQERYGKNKKVFKILKFRSMKTGVDPNLAPSEMDEEYQRSLQTPFGRFLRFTSIDETLQLFNIFIGQMAFIGPRPGSAHNEEELAKEREKYTPNAFDVRPGLGGYAQVKMQRKHDPVEKALLDHEYVKKISFWTDFKLFFETIFSVILRK